MSELYPYEDDTDFDDVFGDLNFTMLHSGEKHRVFVYGTLMSGMRNHVRMESLGAKLISTNAALRGDYTMSPRRTGLNYLAPIVTHGKSGQKQGQVNGEIYDVDSQSLMTLDLFEGHPDVYRREKHDVCYMGEKRFRIESMWVYIFVENDYLDDELGGTDYHAICRTSGSSFDVYKWRGE